MSIKIKIEYIHGETNTHLKDIAFDYNEISTGELMGEIQRGYIEAFNAQPYSKKDGTFTKKLSTV